MLDHCVREAEMGYRQKQLCAAVKQMVSSQHQDQRLSWCCDGSVRAVKVVFIQRFSHHSQFSELLINSNDRKGQRQLVRYSVGRCACVKRGWRGKILT